jgi:hypothetical protein
MVNWSDIVPSQIRVDSGIDGIPALIEPIKWAVNPLDKAGIETSITKKKVGCGSWQYMVAVGNITS